VRKELLKVETTRRLGDTFGSISPHYYAQAPALNDADVFSCGKRIELTLKK
jgi:hypothetical protein